MKMICPYLQVVVQHAVITPICFGRGGEHVVVVIYRVSL